ncbi:MAG: hypothetical protein DRR19_12555 [Candidatus Parabeggiatoa sp. nov. 1]|nr:MAG: hypothetical protein DRR19_12555 [Gammaproteobacteria bacterium]
MYIFLDIDGVLVKPDEPEDEIYLKEVNIEEDLLRFNQDCLKEFENVIRKYNHCQIVISSSWREMFAFKLIKALFSNDVADKIIGVTPIISHGVKHSRYHEILNYLEQNNALAKPWVAIDDIAAYFPKEAPVIITNPKKGFDKHAATKLDDFLNERALPKENLMTSTVEERYDAALGCFLGACVGDAAGAVLEFIGYKPSMAEVKHAMTMSGGGIMGVASGQVTDDSELALCLAQALASSQDFNLEQIAQNYAKWINSHPFDMGMTTRHSLGCFRKAKWQRVCDKEGYAIAMTQAAKQSCTDSKANGSLMRIAPLGIWGSRLDDNELAQCAIKDSSLSHPNESCCDAVACYVIAIARLIENKGDIVNAFNCVVDWANHHANFEVRRWLQNAKENVEVPYHPQVGFIKIAFVHAFRHLLLGTSYQDAISQTLSGGGDTDTNACIVGGLIGAACGASGIPDDMKRGVLHCETHQGTHPRPAFLHTTQLPELTERLLAAKYRTINFQYL